MTLTASLCQCSKPGQFEKSKPRCSFSATKFPFPSQNLVAYSLVTCISTLCSLFHAMLFYAMFSREDAMTMFPPEQEQILDTCADSLECAHRRNNPENGSKLLHNETRDNVTRSCEPELHRAIAQRVTSTSNIDCVPADGRSLYLQVVRKKKKR